MSVNPIPDGYHTVVPYFFAPDVAELLDFVTRAFAAVETEKMMAPDGSIMHAEFQIGDSRIMVGGARDEWPAMPMSIYLYVPNVDELYHRALEAGAESVEALRDEFYGDRVGGVRDAHGNLWWIATHIEDVEPEEMARRMEALGRG